MKETWEGREATEEVELQGEDEGSIERIPTEDEGEEGNVLNGGDGEGPQVEKEVVGGDAERGEDGRRWIFKAGKGVQSLRERWLEEMLRAARVGEADLGSRDGVPEAEEEVVGGYVEGGNGGEALNLGGGEGFHRPREPNDGMGERTVKRE